MANDDTLPEPADGTPRTRRAILAAALGASAATVATALTAPAALAANGDAVTVGGSFTGTTGTQLTSTGTGGPVLSLIADNTAFWGVWVHANAGTGIVTQGKSGLSATANDANGYGVSAYNPGGTAVMAQSTDGSAVYAMSSTSMGVYGTSSSAQGVYGDSNNGVGVYARSVANVALQVDGKAVFSRSGRVSILKGKTYVDVSMAAHGGIASTALCFAHLTVYRTGVWVAAVRPNYPAGKMRIYLNKAITATTYISWIVMG